MQDNISFFFKFQGNNNKKYKLVLMTETSLESP